MDLFSNVAFEGKNGYYLRMVQRVLRGLFAAWVMICFPIFSTLPALAKDYDSIFQVKRDLNALEQLTDKTTLMDLGKGCIKFGLMNEAEGAFKRFIEMYPNVPEGYFFLYQVFVIGGNGRTLQAGRAKAKYELLKALKEQEEGSKQVASDTR